MKIPFALLSLVLCFAMAGCATGPMSTLPKVDVSGMESGKVLSADEIRAAVRGRQLVGDITRVTGNNISNVAHAYEADGTLRGLVPPRYSDVGKWFVTQSTNEICWAWIRWSSDCAVVSVRNGKLHMLNARGTVFLQQ